LDISKTEGIKGGRGIKGKLKREVEIQKDRVLILKAMKSTGVPTNALVKWKKVKTSDPHKTCQ